MDVDANDVRKLKPKARGLGRGLDALFGDEEDSFVIADEQENFQEDTTNNGSSSAVLSPNRKIVGIEQLYPCATQPRKHFDEDALKALSESIKEHGLLQPILVRPDKARSGYFEIVAGERRWRAAQKAHLHEVPVVIRELDDDAMFQISLVENLQRKDLSAMEEARGYKRLNEEFGHSHEEIGKVLGKSRSHIANMIRLIELPDSVQMMVDVGDITAGHARALIGQKNAFDLALQIIEKNLSVRDAEKMAALNEGRDVGTKNKKTKAGFSKKDADTLALEKDISDRLGVGVSLDMKDTQRGKLTVEFKTLDQLDEVLQRLAQPARR